MTPAPSTSSFMPREAKVRLGWGWLSLLLSSKAVALRAEVPGEASRVSMSAMASERSAGRRLTEAFLARDAPAMVAELAPDAVFHSPVADYEGRDRIGAVLAAVTQVVAVPQCSHLIEGSYETLLAFTAE